MKDEITVTISRSAAQQIAAHIRNEYEFSGALPLDTLHEIGENVEQLKALYAIQSALGD